MSGFQKINPTICFNSYFTRFRLILALSLAPCFPPAFAQETNVFVMTGTDGYRVTDCLREQGTCGQIVADAWCESHGFRKAIAFGLADDVTAAIGVNETHAKLEQAAILIRCGQ